jgi:outer membrane protein assembly factor BamB
MSYFYVLARQAISHQPGSFNPLILWMIAMAIGCTAPEVSAIQEELSYFRSDLGLADTEQELPSDLKMDGQLLWRCELPPGHSSPCVIGDSIFLTTYRADSKQLSTVALNRADGSIRWMRDLKSDYLEPVHATGSPATSTPASNGSQVFVFFGSLGLVAYDWQGKPQWELPLGPFQDEFGAASSPILVDDKIILNQDHDIDSFIMAINQIDGSIAWKQSRPEATRSYSTPFVLDRGGKHEILIAGALQLASYDAATGEKLWWYNGLSRIVDCTPTINHGVIYFASWTPGGDADSRISMEPFEVAVAKFDKSQDQLIGRQELPADSPVLDRFFRIDLNQDGNLDKQEWARHASVFERATNLAVALEPGTRGQLDSGHVRWTQTRGLPTVPSSVVYQNVMTMIKDSGIVTVLDVVNGKQLAQFRAAGQGNYYSSLVAGDNKVYMISEAGVMTVISAGRESRVISSYDFGERVMASPVIRGGQLYVRTEAALYCFSKKKSAD